MRPLKIVLAAASLSAALSFPAVGITSAERALLARTVHAEASTEDMTGRRYVVDVVLNRVDSPEFPGSIEDVISQRHQFSTWGSGMIADAEPTEADYQAVDLETAGPRLSTEILFFTAGRYNKYCTPLFRHGRHYFGK